MPTMAELDRAIRGFELEITRRYKAYGNDGFADEQERHELSIKEQELSQGYNFLEWISDGGSTAKYFPSLYYRQGACRNPIADAEVSSGLAHCAFRVGSANIPELYLGKYQGVFKNSNGKNLLLSLRGVDPTVSQTRATFITAGRNNGTGHHMMTNAEYALLALICKSKGFQPRGNNNFGKDASAANERGEIAMIDGQYGPGRCLTGSGPCGWNHDGSPYGIADLNGNIWEFADGLELDAGVIKIIENNNAASSDSSINATYKNILGDGSVVTAGDANALGFAASAAANKIASTSGAPFKNIPQVYGATGENQCPKILKELAIIPHDSGEYGGDYFYRDLTGSRLCVRGGGWDYVSYGGVWCLRLDNGLSAASSNIGARPAFYRS